MIMTDGLAEEEAKQWIVAYFILHGEPMTISKIAKVVNQKRFAADMKKLDYEDIKVAAKSLVLDGVLKQTDDWTAFEKTDNFLELVSEMDKTEIGDLNAPGNEMVKKLVDVMSIRTRPVNVKNIVCAVNYRARIDGGEVFTTRAVEGAVVTMFNCGLLTRDEKGSFIKTDKLKRMMSDHRLKLSIQKARDQAMTPLDSSYANRPQLPKWNENWTEFMKECWFEIYRVQVCGR